MALKLRTWTTRCGDRIQVACCCEHSRRVKEGGPETAGKESRKYVRCAPAIQLTARSSPDGRGIKECTAQKGKKKRGGGHLTELSTLSNTSEVKGGPIYLNTLSGNIDRQLWEESVGPRIEPGLLAQHWQYQLTVLLLQRHSYF